MEKNVIPWYICGKHMIQANLLDWRSVFKLCCSATSLQGKQGYLHSELVWFAEVMKVSWLWNPFTVHPPVSPWTTASPPSNTAGHGRIFQHREADRNTEMCWLRDLHGTYSKKNDVRPVQAFSPVKHVMIFPSKSCLLMHHLTQQLSLFFKSFTHGSGPHSWRTKKARKVFNNMSD